ncbi:MAG: hypothetical protein JSU81_09220 [Candidatus Coatesbacteria bacterium]|nr:MAG: hypothetical protein JSU81_09220 [Candidatus Coatesbacteria bacterium]
MRYGLGALVFVSACVAAAAAAFERDMLNLDTPSGLEARSGVIEIQHRFYGPLDEDPGGTVLGLTEGANVGLGFR